MTAHAFTPRAEVLSEVEQSDDETEKILWLRNAQLAFKGMGGVEATLPRAS